MPVSSSSSSDLELRDAYEKVSIRSYLSDLWSRRSYIWYAALSELRQRQADTVLGNVWHLLNPLLSIGVYYLVFGLLLDIGERSGDNYFLFLSSGLFLFQFTQKATNKGARSIVSNTGLMRVVRFPRALLPVTSTAAEIMAFWSSLVVIYGIAIVSTTFSWTWLLLPVVVAVQALFNVGASLIAARLTTHFRDTTELLPYFFRLLLYGSGVIFSVERFTEDNPTLEFLFTLNPLYSFMTLGRWSVMAGSFDGRCVVSVAVWTLVIVVVGFAWFRAGEEKYARV